MCHPSSHRAGLVFTAALIFGLPCVGLSSASSAEEARVGILEEVVVTARRRSENIQDVPISMTVFNQRQLDNNNITNAGDLALYTPSLQTNNRFGPDTTQFSIRGFTQENRTTASVGVYFAEVVAPRGANTSVSGDGAGPGDLFDLENVQVLKGPQGTLFGRNTTGGAILLTPTRPTDRLEGYVEGSAGNYDMWRGQGVINIPAGDRVRLRFGLDRQERNGYLNNRSGVGPEDMANVDYTAFRASMVVDITDSLENYTIFKTHKSKNNATPSSLIACNTEAFFGTFCQQDLERRKAAGNLDFYDVYSRVPDPTSKQEAWQAINTTTWNVNDSLTLKNILSYAELEGDLRYDIYGTDWRVPTTAGLQPTIVAQAGTEKSRHTTDQKSYVEELRVEGKAFSDRLEWQAGIYYEKSEPINDYGSQSPAFISCDQYTVTAIDPEDIRCNNLLGLGSVSGTPGGVTYENKAIYAQGTYEFNQQWSTTIGLRYTDDKTEGHVDEYAYFFPANASGGYYPPIATFEETRKPSSSSDKPTWLIGLEYTPVDDALVYAKYARGYRQGSVNLAGDTGFDVHGPEEVDTYEIGAKTNFEALVPGLFNIAVFYNDFRDQQLQSGYFKSSGVGTTAILNAGSSTIWGIEAETTVLLTENFSLSASYTYLDTEVDELKVPDMPPELSNIHDEFLLIQSEGGPLSFAPENQLVATASYRLPLDAAWGDITLTATYIYTDEMQSVSPEVSPFAVLPDYDVVNLNLNWQRIAGGPLDLSLFVTNATDEEYYTFVNGNYYDLGLENGQVGQPRMYGLRLRYTFEN